MSGAPVSHAQHPPHGHPDNTSPSTQNVDRASTASHPPAGKPDPTTTSTSHGAQGKLSSSMPSSASQLTSYRVKLRSALRQYPDFPSPGILFEDIMPIFANHATFTDLVSALELQVASAFNTTVGEKSEIDVVVGLESRGFLFGPTLALRLGAGFVPVRKQGKLPGKCVTEGYQKEYGTDHFQVQEDAIKPGQKVIIVDDIIATGGSAAAAGSLVRKLGGDLQGYLFMMELDFLKGREKLDAPVHTLLSGQEESLEASKEKELPLGQTKESAADVRPVADAGGAQAEQRP